MRDLLPTNYKVESIIFVVVFAFLSIWFGIFWHVDRSYGDLDADSTYHFPVYGQDGPRYALLADGLVTHHVFSIDGKTPEVFRTPGYPALLAFSKLMSGGFVLASFIVIILSGFLAVLTFWIARRFLLPRLAILAALAFSLSPGAVFHAIGTFGEIPFTFFLVLSVWLSFFKQERNYKTILASGLSLGMAALIRPVALYYLFFLLPFLFYQWHKEGNVWKNTVKSLAILIIGFLVTTGPWMLRNKVVGGSFSLSTIGPYNLAHYNAALYLESRFGADAPETVSYRAKLHQVPNDQGKLFSEGNALTELAKGVIAENKFSYLAFHLAESTKFFLSSSLRYVILHIQISEVQNYFGLNSASPNLLSLVRNLEVKKIAETLMLQPFLTLDRLLALVVTSLAFIAIFFQRARFHTLVFLGSAVYLALLTGPVSIPRYRLPVEPFLIVLALYSIQEILNTERFKNIFIFTLCIFKLPFSGPARVQPTAPKKILIVQRAQLGDMVCTTPMLSAAKKFYPNVKILLSGKKSNEILMAHHPYVDEYIAFDRNFFETVHLLKAGAIDFAAIVNPDFHGLAAAYLAGIKSISVPVVVGGYTPYETIPYKIIRKFVITKPFAMGAYAPRERLRLLEPLGIVTEDTTKVLGVGEGAKQNVQKWRSKHLLGENDFVVGMALAAGNKVKEWPVERFAIVAAHLIKEHGAKVVVVGAPSDSDKSKEFLSLIKSRDVYDTAGLFSIEELKALIKGLSLFVSVDTGPLYIAEAFNIPTVDIIGPLDEREQPPIGEMHKRVIAEREAPVMHIMNTRVLDVAEARRQVEAISAEMVIEVVDRAMSGIRRQ